MRARPRKQLLLDRKHLLRNFMIIQHPPRLLQLPRHLIRHLLIPQYQPQQMPFQTLGLIIHKRVPRMHHSQVIEKDHIARLHLNLHCVLGREGVQRVEGETLGWGERR